MEKGPQAQAKRIIQQAAVRTAVETLRTKIEQQYFLIGNYEILQTS
jgi:hypothetical protein